MAFFKGEITDVVRKLASMGETKVLACPRLMTLNKQRADVQLGEHLPYVEVSSKDGVTTQTYKRILVGTELRARPFVTSDGSVRLEVQLSRTTGHLDAAGIPQTNAIQISTNVVVPNGMTVVMCDKPRTEIGQHRCPMPLLSFIPGPLSLLGWISYADSLSPSTYCAERKQLVVLLSSHIVKK